VAENRPATPIPIAHMGSRQTTTKYIQLDALNLSAGDQR